MKLRNCPQCGQVFTYIRTNLCPACQKLDEENYKVVRKYIAENPGVGIAEVSEKTGIAEEKILRYLKEGVFPPRECCRPNCNANFAERRYKAAVIALLVRKN